MTSHRGFQGGRRSGTGSRGSEERKGKGNAGLVMSDDDDAGEFVDLDCNLGIWVASFCHVLRV